MTSLLVACSGNPLRLRAQGNLIYSRDAVAIAGSLISLPLWVLAATNCPPPARVDMAAYWLSALGLVEIDSSLEAKRRLVTTASGQKWITFSPKERLNAVLLIPVPPSVAPRVSLWFLATLSPFLLNSIYFLDILHL